jgi:hypothetical protein
MEEFDKAVADYHRVKEIDPCKFIFFTKFSLSLSSNKLVS